MLRCVIEIFGLPLFNLNFLFFPTVSVSGTSLSCRNKRAFFSMSSVAYEGCALNASFAINRLQSKNKLTCKCWCFLLVEPLFSRSSSTFAGVAAVSVGSQHLSGVKGAPSSVAPVVGGVPLRGACAAASWVAGRGVEERQDGGGAGGGGGEGVRGMFALENVSQWKPSESIRSSSTPISNVVLSCRELTVSIPNLEAHTHA